MPKPRLRQEDRQRARRAMRMIPGAAPLQDALQIFNAPGQESTRNQNMISDREAARRRAEAAARRQRNLRNDCARHGDC